MRKRENYRSGFDEFDPVKVADYDEARIEVLLQNPGNVRGRQKVKSAVQNAEAFLKIREEFGSFDTYIWGFVDGQAHPEPMGVNARITGRDHPG